MITVKIVLTGIGVFTGVLYAAVFLYIFLYKRGNRVDGYAVPGEDEEDSEFPYYD